MPRRSYDLFLRAGLREAGHRHAEGAGVDGKAHGGAADTEPVNQRRQDRLCGKEVDKRQEGDQGDEAETQGVSRDRGETALIGILEDCHRKLLGAGAGRRGRSPNRQDSRTVLWAG